VHRQSLFPIKSNTPGDSYPVSYGAAAIQGRLVHEALEESRKGGYEDGDGTSFNARRFIKRRLRELLAGDIAANPRLDPGRLQTTFSLDECLARFYALVGSGESPIGHSSFTYARIGPSSHPPEEAEELWVEVEEPPVVGRIDRVRRGVISDFKTGEANPEEHEAQLRFYALLWWLRFRQVPAGLELLYPGETRRIDPPSPNALEEEANHLRAEIGAIVDVLNKPPPPARPSLEGCQYCPVRQLCPEYWTSPITKALRCPEAIDTVEGASLFRDSLLSEFPNGWSTGRSLTGKATIAGIGKIEVSLESRFCPGVGEVLPTQGRLLNVLLVYRNAAWTLRSVASSEAFWSK
jgi:PD-(D/E)XK nuclease superfamily